MRRRVLLSTCLIALAAVVVLGLPLAIVGTELLQQRADSRLERRADIVALRLVRAQAQRRPLTRALIADVLPAGEAVQITAGARRVTLGVRPAGKTVTINAGDAGSLDLALLAPAADRNDDVGIVWLAVAGSGLAALLAAVVLATVQSRRLAAPIEQLAERVEDVGHADYDDRPVAGNLPEIDRLQQALNAADRRIGELVRHEREFTANASHQLRSPLTGLRLRLEELRHLAQTADAICEADAALAQADRLTETIEHLELVARVRDDRPAALDVGDQLRAHLAQERWQERFAGAGRTLTIAGPPGVRAHVHPESLRQIFDVLLANALQHGRGETAVSVTGGDVATVAVSDAGPRSQIASNGDIFARGVGHGSGIGLDVARDLARRSGGELRLADARSTRFEATFATATRARV